MNLRALIETDLSQTLEGEFAMLVTLISPDGVVYSNGVDGNYLKGQVVYEKIELNTTTGAEQVVREPAITLRVSNLVRVPVSGEKWVVKFPDDPREGTVKSTYVLDGSRAIQSGESIGFIRLFPKKVKVA